VTEGRKYFPQGPYAASGPRVVQPWRNVRLNHRRNEKYHRKNFVLLPIYFTRF